MVRLSRVCQASSPLFWETETAFSMSSFMSCLRLSVSAVSCETFSRATSQGEITIQRPAACSLFFILPWCSAILTYWRKFVSTALRCCKKTESWLVVLWVREGRSVCVEPSEERRADECWRVWRETEFGRREGKSGLGQEEVETEWTLWCAIWRVREGGKTFLRAELRARAHVGRPLRACESGREVPGQISI